MLAGMTLHTMGSRLPFPFTTRVAPVTFLTFVGIVSASTVAAHIFGTAHAIRHETPALPSGRWPLVGDTILNQPRAWWWRRLAYGDADHRDRPARRAASPTPRHRRMVERVIHVFGHGTERAMVPEDGDADASE